MLKKPPVAISAGFSFVRTYRHCTVLNDAAMIQRYMYVSDERFELSARVT